MHGYYWIVSHPGIRYEWHMKEKGKRKKQEIEKKKNERYNG